MDLESDKYLLSAYPVSGVCYIAAVIKTMCGRARSRQRISRNRRESLEIVLHKHKNFIYGEDGISNM